MSESYRCQCILRWSEDGVACCLAVVSGPDEPMCEDCLRNGHDTSHQQVPWGDPQRQRLALAGVLRHP